VTTNTSEATNAGGATPATRAAHARIRAQLPWDDRDDFACARRGLITTLPDGVIRDAEGRVVWDIGQFGFLDGEAPDTVNPSLWRHAQLNAVHGLFAVTPGIWQARGFDISNVTFVRGATGWIVIDPLTTAETARAALDLLSRHVEARPVRAVLYTHSHVDHFGGVRGVVSDEDVRAGRVPIVAPAGFLEAAISENVIAGGAMARRALYQFGNLLPCGPRGVVDAGVGKTIPSGTVGLIPPTVDVTTTGQELELDGVRFVFLMAPDSEAPAELCFFLPGLRALCMAELCTATLHNVYTLRGAQVRDALAWSRYIDEALERFAADSDVVFASHTWPRWGGAVVRDFLGIQRDLYRHIHDQTMRLANRGLTMHEVAEEIVLPETIATKFHARGYYGSVVHNAKAVYQRYLGWFDGNPAHLHPLPPVEAARRYVALTGGIEALLEKAEAAYEAGDYRWVAELVNHAVFAEPEHAAARALQARALEQLGYQAESAIWRNFFLSGAHELRHGVVRGRGPGTRRGARGTIPAMSAGMLFDALGVRIDATRAAGKRLRINMAFTDTGEEFVLRLDHATLGWVAGRQDADADVTVRLARATLDELVLSGMDGRPAAPPAGAIAVEGPRPEALIELFGLLERPDPDFAIVTP
jgi:alkyl sulfatase BDS1-like metallo-beta-lactamase superfamily hydrolase